MLASIFMDCSLQYVNVGVSRGDCQVGECFCDLRTSEPTKASGQRVATDRGEGHRIWASLILDFLASGMSIPELLGKHSGLEEAGIDACITYGAEMARERYVNIPLEPKA